MSTQFRLLLPRPFYQDMVQQAQTEKPNECCGLLGGMIAKSNGESRKTALVTRRYPLINALQSPTEYESDAKGLLRASRQMREAEIDLLAVYHSHPTSAPRPSHKDIDRNMGMQVMHLIISLQSAKPEVCAWWLNEIDFLEAEWEIQP